MGLTLHYGLGQIYGRMGDEKQPLIKIFYYETKFGWIIMIEVNTTYNRVEKAWDKIGEPVIGHKCHMFFAFFDRI